ncbi:hypothetical protein L1049_008899 [Liquidambar formosana]|uniref:Uncharacterized protein n=1 Tax=Liquidambar formosana TaxID=63359 RepID=A0AAP0X9L9_LIQFO
MNTKIIALLLVVVMMVNSCLAAPRRALNQHVEKGIAAEGNKSGKGEVENPESTIDNHHTIPRQNYNNWGADTSDGDNGDDNNGSG